VWLGSGVPFRTLHTKPKVPNPERLSILGLRQGTTQLTLNIQDDELIGTDLSSGTIVRGTALKGSVIELWDGSPVVPAYELTITDVQPSAYWADCPACPKISTWLYSFQAVNMHDHCQVRLCQPGLDEDAPSGLVGRAVMFRGDLYDELTHGVQTQNPDDDRFNFACLGTALSKLHMFRHTSASKGVATMPQREALLKAITADYCGDGSAFTHDGHPIRFGFNSASPPYASPYDILPASGYALSCPTPPGPGKCSPAITVDAAWTDTGALCIDTPRLLDADHPALPGTTATELLRDINDACQRRRGKTPFPHIPSCSSLPPPPAVTLKAPFARGNDIVSANPKPL
jgi:hypothetical protein